MEEPTIRLVDGTFTYKKGEEVKTLDFYASYQKCSGNILLVIQGYSPTITNAAGPLLLTYGREMGMVIALSRMEYTNFITNVLDKGIQLSVQNRIDKMYETFPGTWSGKIINELPPKPNSPSSSCSIAGGRRRTRRRKHKRRSTRRRHHRR